MKNGPKKTGTQKNKQMTKESILNKIDEPDNNLIFDGDNRMIGYDGDVRPILRAMDEYAKQQAIAYCEWYCSLGYLPKVKNKEDHKPGESYMKEHEQLYKEFLEQQNKDNESNSGRSL